MSEIATASAPASPVTIEEPRPAPVTEKAPETFEELMAMARVQGLKTLAAKGLSEAEVAQFRQNYRRIALIPVGEDLYVIRALTRKEWRGITEQREQQAKDGKESSDLEMEERIASKTILFPQINEIMLRTGELAGLATTISDAVMLLSGFLKQPAQPIVL